MVFCKNCSSRINDGVTICPICGANAFTGEVTTKKGMPKFNTASSRPAPTGYPASPARPAPTGYPASPARPASTGYPASPARPGPTGYPASPARSAPTGYPASPARPAPMGYPASPARPAPMGYPSPIRTSAPGAHPSGIMRKDVMEEPLKDTPESTEFIKSTSRVSNIILSILIVITLVIGGCLAYTRFLASPEKSAYASEAEALLGEYVQSLNDGDVERLNSISFVSQLSNDQVEKIYKSSMYEITKSLSYTLSKLDDCEITVEGIFVTDLNNAELEEIKSKAPSGIEVVRAVNIKCIMNLENDDETDSRTRNLSAIQIGDNWYMYRL